MRFVFSHMPKTGGTSVIASFRWAGLEVFKASFAIAATPDAWIRGCRAEHGLFASRFLFMERRPASADVYFTWLRDPVDLLYSAFYWYRSHSPTRIYRPRATGELLRRLVERHSRVEGFVDDILEHRYRDAFPREWFRRMGLDGFDFVGITERMRESLSVFNARYGTALKAVHANAIGAPKQYRREEVREFLGAETEIYSRYAERSLDQ